MIRFTSPPFNHYWPFNNIYIKYKRYEQQNKTVTAHRLHENE